jgi:hypothetical protein
MTADGSCALYPSAPTAHPTELHAVTPRITNPQGRVKHVSTNARKLKATRIPMGKIEKFKFCHCSDDPIQEFWRFYETE